jgi:uncharacterized protein (TIGR00369 family)
MMAVFEVDRPVGPLSFVLKEVGEGTVTWAYTVDRAHFNPNGVLHGGVVMSLLDTAMGHAVAEVVGPKGRFNAAAQFNVHFLLPIRTGTIRARATIVKVGKRTAVVEARALDEDDAVLAIATATHSLLP